MPMTPDSGVSEVEIPSTTGELLLPYGVNPNLQPLDSELQEYFVKHRESLEQGSCFGKILQLQRKDGRVYNIGFVFPTNEHSKNMIAVLQSGLMMLITQINDVQPEQRAKFKEIFAPSQEPLLLSDVDNDPYSIYHAIRELAHNSLVQIYTNLFDIDKETQNAISSALEEAKEYIENFDKTPKLPAETPQERKEQLEKTTQEIYLQLRGTLPEKANLTH